MECVSQVPGEWLDGRVGLGEWAGERRVGEAISWVSKRV